MKKKLITMAQEGKEAAAVLRTASANAKNNALMDMAQALRERQEEILATNRVDLEAGKEAGLTSALLDRLALDEGRIEGMAKGLEDLVALPDPIGEVFEQKKRPQGFDVGKMRVPLGVVAMIYEARPNVTVDAAGLCLKTGNAVILRGGSEAINSNTVLAKIISEAATGAGLPQGAIGFVENTDRTLVGELIRLRDYIDVVIPRGGAGLIRTVVEGATVPVIETGVGNCHTYLDRSADSEMAYRIALNAKLDRPGVCNAMETLLVHEEVAEALLPKLAKELQAQKVELRGCPKTQKLLGISSATDEDWATEYLDYILAIKIVSSFEEAIAHIAKYSSGHSEAIVTEDYTAARKFLAEVDAAAVYVNASTRFTDGGEFGLGAEIGISTQKLHARGPMGLEALTTTKYVITGDGQIR